MKSFIEYINLDEALITFGNKAYPKFGQVVLLAGGAASGKSFSIKNLLGIEGNILDVDHLKTLVMKSQHLAADIKDKTGKDVNKMNLRDPDDVGALHKIISTTFNISGKNNAKLYTGIIAADAERKPNLIIDTTLRSVSKLASYSRELTQIGYSKENIHIVWVVNDVHVSVELNKNRDRVVPIEVLVDTHEGASLTMAKLLNMGDQLKQYMDGDIWISFNKIGVDSDIKKSDAGGMYITKSNYLKVKAKGKVQRSLKDLDAEFVKKVANYVPKTDTWDNQ
ncbi:hypothetical protein POP12_045 [Pectobacterium phage POP12]|nr:hypothetical protein POP12_045 [Pectobacterium phage POP12]